jgi:hypothetical protein
MVFFSQRRLSMLMYLDFDLLHLAAADRLLLRSATKELIRAYRLGHHVLVIRRPEASWLRTSLELDAQEQSALAEIAREFTQTADLIRRADRYLAIVPAKQGGAPARMLQAELGDVVKPYFLDRTALVVEDINTDGRLYD